MFLLIEEDVIPVKMTIKGADGKRQKIDMDEYRTKRRIEAVLPNMHNVKEEPKEVNSMQNYIPSRSICPY